MVIHKDAELKARIKILKYLNFLLCVKQQPFFSGKRLIPVEMKKNMRLLQFMESHGILKQFFSENMDMKVCVLSITAMNIHSKNSCCILTAYL